MIFNLLKSVKMPTFVGILTLISRIYTTSFFKARKIFILKHFSLYKQLKFHARVEHEKFYELGASLSNEKTLYQPGIEIHSPILRCFLAKT